MFKEHETIIMYDVAPYMFLYSIRIYIFKKGYCFKNNTAIGQVIVQK